MTENTENTPSTIWFFGTFNPVHNGHLAVAQAALQAFPALETVTFVPAGQPPHKSPQTAQLAPAADRLAMLQLAVADNRAFSVSEAETRHEGVSYTFETLKRLGLLGLSEPPSMVIGVDAFNTLASWHRAAELLVAVHFLVAPRDGVPIQTRFEIAGNVYEPLFSAIPMPETPVSSSQVRRHLQEGLPLVALLPGAVQNYIVEHGLYGQRVPSSGGLVG